MIIKYYINRIVLFGAILFSFTACQSDNVYNKTLNISNSWHYTDTVLFEFDIKEVKPYDLVLNINHDENFKYQNLYCKVNMTYPDGTVLDDVVSLELSTHPGLWDASCSSGDCDLEILLQKNARFPTVGKYTLSINQHSRDSLLVGINALGLEVKKVID